MMWSSSLEKEHQVARFVVDHQIQVDQLGLEDQILVVLQVQKMVGHRAQNVEDHQAQNVEDRQVRNGVGHLVLSVVDPQVQRVGNFRDHLEVDSHLGDHLVENCSVVLADTHCPVGNCSGLVDTDHQVDHCNHQVHFLHSFHCIL